MPPIHSDMLQNDISGKLGAHEAKLTDQDRRLERIENKVDMLLESQNQAKGAVRMIIFLAGGTGFLSGGAAATAAVAILKATA